MTCPNIDMLNLLAMEALEETEAKPLLDHLGNCPECRAQLEAARMDHFNRMRMYDSFDRNHDALRDQLMASLPAVVPANESGISGSWHRLGEILMNTSTTNSRRTLAVLAPAACLLIAVTLFIATGRNNVLAAALEHLKLADTIVAEISFPDGTGQFVPGTDLTGKIYISNEYGSMTELYVNGEESRLQYAPVNGPMILVSPDNKTYIELTIENRAADNAAIRTPSAWLNWVRQQEVKAQRKLGSKIINGQQVVGYCISGYESTADSSGNLGSIAAMEIWVDEESGLPVEFRKTIDVDGTENPIAVVISGFQWNVPLDPTIFEPKVTDEYTRFDGKIPMPSEERLLEALVKTQELTGGIYTTSLQSVTAIAEIKTMLTDKSKSELDELDQQGILKLGLKIASGYKYYNYLQNQGCRPEYFGESVTAKDKDKVLLQWHLDNNQIRVIYGDLRIETIDE